ncbi:hypothetical protein TrVFT333_006639 [Trichoderma virens FT-333]|nr:hypothetical protein TrVFT333_006639 [Trichoderma virens FT-333]
MELSLSCDEEDYYEAYCEDINDAFENSDGKITLNLYHHSNASATTGQGSVKTAYRVKDDGAAIYAEEKSDYSISIERLLWVDGFEESSPVCNGAQRKAMTLAVLRMVFKSSSRDTRIEWARAVLKLEGTDKSGKGEPLVEAWAPFSNLQRSNESESHREKTVQIGVECDPGFDGVAPVSIQLSRERRISWNQAEYDEAFSTPVFSKITNNRNGVDWYMRQNPLQNQGVPPETMASVLFSRNSPDPYMVSFRIYIRAGTLNDIANRVKNFFGLKPGQTYPFLVSPGGKPICHSEGREIFQNIDINNLGALRESKYSNKLNIKWESSTGVSGPPDPLSELNGKIEEREHFEKHQQPMGDQEENPQPEDETQLAQEMKTSTRRQYTKSDS